jgi:hypothetical protein
MKRSYRRRRSVVVLTMLIGILVAILVHPDFQQAIVPSASPDTTPTGDAAVALNQLEVKGRAPKTGYARSQFGSGWALQGGCDMRNIILHRDLENPAVDGECHVIGGTLNDPYTGKTIIFQRGAGTSDDVQIDHVVALSDAWQKGAQQLSSERRGLLANDPLELLAVDGSSNQQKSDGDAATWLPPYKGFRCQYVARQIAVKRSYSLWVTAAEKEAIVRVLAMCPGQTLPSDNVAKTG